MAAMLSSSTLLGRAPAPASAPGTLLSPTAALQLRKQPVTAALQLRKQPAPVAASSVALTWSRSRRASLFTCHADAGNAAKFNYDDLQPSVLETGSTLFAFEATPAGGVEASRKASTLLAGENWSMMGDRDVIILKLRVGKQPPPKDDKEKAAAGWFSTTSTAPDQAGAGLVIKYTGSPGVEHPASSLDKTLAMPRDYDPGRVKLKWFEEWLLVIIDKGLRR